MIQSEKVNQLAGLIAESIVPLINRNYVLYGLPYYANIGDTLIWQGELEVLKRVPHRCVGVCGWQDYPTTPVPEDVIILITGGGYFGDVWRPAWEHVLKGISMNVNNRIIVLPSSIYYEDARTRAQDAKFLSQFKNLLICARDEVSYAYAQQHFTNPALLVPDMAFAIPPASLNRWRVASSSKTLFLKRNDKEYVNQSITLPEVDVDVHDWPTMDEASLSNGEKRFFWLLTWMDKFRYHFPVLTGSHKALKDWMYKTIYRKIMLSRGVKFITSYRKVYTTRLHVMILSVLLGKEVQYINNNNGKLEALYNTWLRDCEGVSKFKRVGDE
jgi:pyruvyl transferase EpsO